MNLEPQSLMSQLQILTTEVHQKLLAEFENTLKSYIQNNLKELGFEFKNDPEFFDFLSKRVQQIAFDERPHYYELHLDFGTENQKLIGIYGDEIVLSKEGSKFTATIGIPENPITFQ